MIDSKQFRSALGSFTTGVTIVTTRAPSGHDVGLTANSFNSVSLDPPMVLWSLAKTASSMPVFKEAPHFAVHILAADQEPLSRLFAQRGADRFAGLRLERGLDGIPLLDGCAARFQCRTAFQHEGGDHTIFVGEVVSFDHFDRSPMVFAAGNYAFAVQKADVASTSASAEPEYGFSRDFLGYLLGVAHFQLSARVRREVDRRGLTEEGYFVLGLLGAKDKRTIAEMDGLVRLTGGRVTSAIVDDLAQRGLVTTIGLSGPSATAQLTPAGRASLIEFAAIAKAAEADVEERLTFEERQLLKTLLRRTIAGSDAGLP